MAATSKKFSVGLFRNDVRVGEIVFNTLLVTHPEDYDCRPAGVLQHCQVVDLSALLRRLPPVLGGRIGDYRWQEE